MGASPIKLIQISDMHLGAALSSTLLGVNTHESFQAVIDLIRKKEKMDLVILSGDLSQDGSEAAYIHLAKALNWIEAPIYCLPGNHDNVQVLNTIYSLEKISTHKQIILNNWQIILLNSQKPGAVEGHLAAEELNYLCQCLAAYPKHHVAIILHHQPMPVGSQWLDKVGLTNADEFWQTIAPYTNIKMILFGHVHQEFAQTVNGIKCYSTPSTCIQFKSKRDDFSLENLPPGYRWAHLYDDGRIETGVCRLADYIGVFDTGAKGY